MKTFASFIREQWKMEGIKDKVFVNDKDPSEKIVVSTYTEYKKTTKNSRLRDPKKTKWMVIVKHQTAKNVYGTEIFFRSISNAEGDDARARKAKVAKAAVKATQKQVGVDITPALDVWLK